MNPYAPNYGGRKLEKGNTRICVLRDWMFQHNNVIYICSCSLPCKCTCEIYKDVNITTTQNKNEISDHFST